MNQFEKLIAGLCPDGVPVYALGEIGTTVSGLRGKSKHDFTEGNAPYISYVDIYKNPGIDFIPEKRVKVEASENQSAVKLGDVLVTGSSETRNQCGMTAVITSQPSVSIYVNSFCFIWRPNPGIDLDPHFAKHLFRGRAFRDQVIQTANVVTRQNISKPKFLAIEIPLPPVMVQRKIASILNEFEKLEAELETELKAELEARLVQRNFVINAFQNRQLPELKKAIQIPLEDLVHFENGKPHEPLVNPDGDCELITAGYIASNGIHARKINYGDIRTLARIDDITIVLSDLPNGKALGKCYFVQRADFLAVNQRIAILRSKDVVVASPEYLYHFVNRNPQILKFDDGSTQTHLKKANVLDTIVHLPDIETQRKIATELTKLEKYMLAASENLPAELEARQKQYEYYRTKLLKFRELEVV